MSKSTYLIIENSFLDVFHFPGKDGTGTRDIFSIPGLSRTIWYMWSLVTLLPSVRLSYLSRTHHKQNANYFGFIFALGRSKNLLASCPTPKISLRLHVVLGTKRSSPSAKRKGQDEVADNFLTHFRLSWPKSHRALPSLNFRGRLIWVFWTFRARPLCLVLLGFTRTSPHVVTVDNVWSAIVLRWSLVIQVHQSIRETVLSGGCHVSPHDSKGCSFRWCCCVLRWWSW